MWLSCNLDAWCIVSGSIDSQGVRQSMEYQGSSRTHPSLPRLQKSPQARSSGGRGVSRDLAQDAGEASQQPHNLESQASTASVPDAQPAASKRQPRSQTPCLNELPACLGSQANIVSP